MTGKTKIQLFFTLRIFINRKSFNYRNIRSVENLSVAIAAMGEGWHNYHHVFPWDYKTSEFGDYTYNLTTGFIDIFAKLGWAYDRKCYVLNSNANFP